MSHPSTPQYFVADWLLSVSRLPIRQGFLAVRDGKVEAVGAIADLPEPVRNALPEVIPGSLITPGLVNVHTHLEQSFEETIVKAPDETFVHWLLKVRKTNGSAETPEDKLKRCRVGARQVLESGTTCVNDISANYEALEVLDEMGLRGIVSPEFFHPAYEGPLQLDRYINIYRNLVSRFGRHPRLQVGLSPHSPYNVSPRAWRAMLEACDPPLVHTHLAEFADEHRYFAGEPETLLHQLHQTILNRTFGPEKPAESPVDYLHTFDLLSNRLVAAHVIHTTLADRIQFASHRVAVAHCPRSNVHLHGRTLNWADWAETALPIGLGTDGRLSTEDLDLRAEARFAMSLHGWTAEHALRRMTIEGASVMRMEDIIGSLEPGKKADFVLWQAAYTGQPPEVLALDAETTVQAAYVDGMCRYQRQPAGVA